MQINNVTAVNMAESAPALQGVAGGTAGTNDFMLILLAQMTHQNPLEPMKDSEMMGQYAQLNSVQQLQSINAALTQMMTYNQTSYAASLIGKVARIAKDDGTSLEGEITGISMESGRMLVQIGDQKAPLENVVEIKGQ